MASFFFQDGADPEHEGASAKHLRSIRGGRARPQERHSTASAWSETPSRLNAADRRAEAAPPDLFARSPSNAWAWMKQAWAWLWDMDELPRQPAATTGLGVARNEFHSAIWDLQSLKANQLRDQIGHARSLRELWHLRADVFKLIAMHRGQVEAQKRLDVLDAHFPVRSQGRMDARTGRVAAW